MPAHLLRLAELEGNDQATGGDITPPAEQADDCLSIARQDIDFFSLDRGRVAIQIRVANRSAVGSPAATAIVRAAPFGAFVPWQTLASVSVPALAPGKVCYLRTGAAPLHPEPLGSPDRVPPRKLLTALGLADEPPGKPDEPPRDRQPATMPADLMELLVQETPHWIGNLNVLVGKTDVERHLARALRVYPGRLNLAWFVVGAPGSDAYRFRVEGSGKHWETKLFDMTTRESLVLNVDENTGIPAGPWIPSSGTRTMLLALRVPADCRREAVEVHVTQQSTGRTAVVEFSLDAAAAGKGCYAV
jgi:hypothetical protein